MGPLSSRDSEAFMRVLLEDYIRVTLRSPYTCFEIALTAKPLFNGTT